jgi:hypothetical protein
MDDSANRPTPPAVEPNSRRFPFPVCALAAALALFTVALYWPAMKCGFLDYDDPVYITSNPRIQAGLTLDNVEWAFFTPDVRFGYWHPMTLLSHMLDCQLYDLHPGGHHLTNVLLHALNGVLLFLLFRRLTGSLWRSATVAALFAAHPLHVESVAWVAERKDVLSAAFGLLALLSYARYVEELKIKNAKCKMWGGLSLLFFGLGLLSKPMLVTLPFVMLLLDYWPMGRIANVELRMSNYETLKSFVIRNSSLAIEKIPFIALAIAISAVTFFLSKQGGMMTHGETLPFGARAGNALVSYCRYVGKCFWPANLSVYYPWHSWSAITALSAGALLLALTLVAFAQARQRPFLLVGWLWFIGMLVPVVGLAPVGDFAMADRFTYLPLVGIFIVVAWGAVDLAGRHAGLRTAFALAGCAAVLACAAVTRQQLCYWLDSESLFRHAIAVTQGNFLAHNNLGTALYEQHRYDEAVDQLEQAIAEKPDYVYAHNNLGLALFAKGQV